MMDFLCLLLSRDFFFNYYTSEVCPSLFVSVLTVTLNSEVLAAD